MREIKFRAWNNELKTMTDNNNLQGTLGSMILATRSDGKEFTFMQHTGLKDSEGLEIYEGDIIKYRDFNDKNHYLLVQWSKENADRKSTRLNSSHVAISYAVFCLKQI